MRAIPTAPAAPAEASDPPWLAQFLANLAREDLSPATLRGYRYDLRHFLRWYQGLQDALFEPGRLAGYDLSAYRQQMIAAGRRPATINGVTGRFMEWPAPPILAPR